ncbi:MAG: SOS response-associated peptidase [Verrucomicrobiota bacterium]
MCGRFALKKAHLAQIARQAAAMVGEHVPPGSRYNIPPGVRIAVIRNRAAAGGRELTDLHWGLTPAWTGPDARPVTNARAETAADKPTFREAIRRRRCLIPATAFYEWTAGVGARRPWAFLAPDGEPFCLGGLWEDDACAVVTTAANTVMAPVHHRMPVLLAPGDYDAWLDPRSDLSTTALTSLLQPAPAGRLIARPVSTRINAVRNDDEACLAEAAHAEAEPDAQLELGW